MFKIFIKCLYSSCILRRGSEVEKFQISVAPKALMSMNELAREKKQVEKALTENKIRLLDLNFAKPD